MGLWGGEGPDRRDRETTVEMVSLARVPGAQLAPSGEDTREVEGTKSE